MTSKERVHAALKREPVDRVPIFMWFHPDTAARMASLLEIPPSDLSEVMGDDVRQAWVANNYAMEGITHEHDGEGHVDDWGIEWVKQGPFNQIARSPLKGADADAIRAYEYPYGSVEQLLHNMDSAMALADEYFVGCDVSPCAFEQVYRLCGMEQAILGLAADPDLSRAMLEDAAAFAVRLAEAACDEFALDWLWTGDDVGGQESMIMSPQCWRGIIRPNLQRVFDVGVSRGLPVAYHSCGAIRPIVPDLIEMGMDVLNPVQSTCPGMDPVDLKKEFGEHITFMGGVDTQELLPDGSADDVRRETESLLDGMTSGGGGYILAASHTIPPETPFENIFALYDCAGVSREQIHDAAADIRSHAVEAD